MIVLANIPKAAALRLVETIDDSILIPENAGKDAVLAVMLRPGETPEYGYVWCGVAVRFVLCAHAHPEMSGHAHRCRVEIIGRVE